MALKKNFYNKGPNCKITLTIIIHDPPPSHEPNFHIDNNNPKPKSVKNIKKILTILYVCDIFTA